ncbi:MAG: hypothetical protein ACE5K4_11880 [Candidatus Hydrothermarchaeota archaeon]
MEKELSGERLRLEKREDLPSKLLGKQDIGESRIAFYYLLKRRQV